MAVGEVVYESGATLSHVYFPTNAIDSLLYVMENGASAHPSQEQLIHPASSKLGLSRHQRLRARVDVLNGEPVFAQYRLARCRRAEPVRANHIT
jgi:hypothetical protein